MNRCYSYDMQSIYFMFAASGFHLCFSFALWFIHWTSLYIAWLLACFWILIFVLQFVLAALFWINTTTSTFTVTATWQLRAYNNLEEGMMLSGSFCSNLQNQAGFKVYLIRYKFNDMNLMIKMIIKKTKKQKQGCMKRQYII